MLWSMLTVFSYTLSSLGDKFIASKMKCKPSEFAFIVSSSTIIWLGLMLPFHGWQFEFNQRNLILLAFLSTWKLIEFYTSALLLKVISAYELKAWLGINVIISYVCDVINGGTRINLLAILFSIILIVSIAMITYEQKHQEFRKLVLYSLMYITSKFMYGYQMNILSKKNSSLSAIFIVMLIVALMQLPKINPIEIVHKKGISLATLSRIPNAAGLLTEAMAALQSVFLYALIQPMQLAVLFVFSITKKEKMGKIKFVGSILSIISVCVITIIVIL